MAVAVESSTLKSAPAHCIFSALIKIVSRSSLPESVADLASLITGKWRVNMADSLGAKADNKVAAKADHRVVAKADHMVLGMADHRKVRVISPHFFSN